ncbi:MAG: UDP-3-O-acyl-N-acetylglucosamine deacetylase [Alphaproteobacteria bacterium]|nr:UDP-3-O-acyl-N-acetylglucosamine deacetylase [Alphaproteobacteria bacterium]
MQGKTIAHEIELSGIGTHSGKNCKVVLKPAREGITINDKQLGINLASATSGSTTVNGLQTIEHLLAAIHMLGITAIDIEGTGETPIFDGSAQPIIEKLLEIGTVEIPTPGKILKVKKEVVFENKHGRVSLSPADKLTFDIEIDYPDIAAIGKMKVCSCFADMDKILESRSFARLSDIERWRAAGMALGASLETGIGLSDTGEVLNPEGLRDEKEFVYHKILDAAGDLMTCGYPVCGAYKSVKGGHAHNNGLVRALMADPSNYEII